MNRMFEMRVIWASVAFVTVSLWLSAGCGNAESTAEATTNNGQNSAELRQLAASQPLPGDPATGEAVYKRACAGCHAADGRGNGGVTGADLVGDPSRLAKDNKTLLKGIRDGIFGGRIAMPPHRGILSDQQMNDVLAYVRKTFTTPAN